MRDHAFASWLGTVTVALGLAAVAHGQVPTGLIPIGRPRVQEGLRVTAAYMVGAAPLEPAARPAARPVEGTLTIHLEVEVEAVHDNPYGLGALRSARADGQGRAAVFQGFRQTSSVTTPRDLTAPDPARTLGAEIPRR